jgi:hypothetical protein
MMSALGGRPVVPADDWNSEERKLFKNINALANRDDAALSIRKQEVLPNVLLHLLATGYRSPRAMLDAALGIRESRAGRDYRALLHRLREAWLLGRTDADAEGQLKQVAIELRERISGKPMMMTGLEIQGTIKGGIGKKIDLGDRTRPWQHRRLASPPEKKGHVPPNR